MVGLKASQYLRNILPVLANKTLEKYFIGEMYIPENTWASFQHFHHS